MTFEEKALYGYIPDFARLSEAGFVRSGEGWTMKAGFMDGDFEAVIDISADGAVSGRVIDTADGGEYLPLRSESRVGPYVSHVRDAYAALLLDIAGRCFVRRMFVSDQANRIAAMVKERFGEEPDFPFSAKEYKAAAVFRNAGNRRWYGLIMNIPKNRLSGEKSSDPADVLNVKHDEAAIPKLLEKAGIYPAYHMQKRYWVSVILDDTLSDGEVFGLICRSRDFTVGKSAVSAGNEDDGFAAASWVIPANPAIYDIEGEMAAADETWWHQSTDVHAGDHVYIYVASPVKAILWRFTVTGANVPLTEEEISEYKSKWRRKMILKRDREYDRAKTGLDTLKMYGLSSVRGARRLPTALEEYMESLDL